MLLPKHDVPLSPQDTANAIRPIVDTDSTANKRTDPGLYPQYEGQLKTGDFAQRNVTDNLGNFRLGEELPPLSPQVDETTMFSPQENKDTALSPKDNEYMTADMTANDNIKSGFLENMFKEQENGDTKNFDLRPGSEISDYLPSTYWNPYESYTDPNLVTLKSNIASPNEQLQQLESLQDEVDYRPSIPTDMRGRNNIEVGTRPGEAVVIGQPAGVPDSQKSTTKIKLKPDTMKVAYPNPKKYGWNYFNDREKEEEKRDKKKQKDAIDSQLKSQGLFYPKPLVKGTISAKTPVTPAAMKLKVKVERGDNGQYVMNFKGPMKGTKILISPTTKAGPPRSAFEDVVAPNKNQANQVVPALVGARISEEKLPGAKEKTVSIKVPANVSLSSVLRNIYQHMYTTYFHGNKSPDQNGRPENDDEAKKIIESLVAKDMQNLPSIVVNSTDKKSETTDLSASTNRHVDDTTKEKDYLQKMYHRQVKVSKEMQQQHNAAHARDKTMSGNSLPNDLQQQQQQLQYVNPWSRSQEQQQWMPNSPASSFTQQPFYTPNLSQETQSFASNLVQQQQQIPGAYANGMLNLNVQLPPVMVSSYKPPTSITFDQGDTNKILKSIQISPLQYAGGKAEYPMPTSMQFTGEKAKIPISTPLQYPGGNSNIFTENQMSPALQYTGGNAMTQDPLSSFPSGKSNTDAARPSVQSKGKNLIAKVSNPPVARWSVSNKTTSSKSLKPAKVNPTTSKKTLPRPNLHINVESNENDAKSDFAFLPAGKIQKFIGGGGEETFNNINNNNNNSPMAPADMVKTQADLGKDHEPIENFLTRLEDDKATHKEEEFNLLASKMLGIPLSLIKQEHESDVNEEEKVRKSKLSSGQTTPPHVDKKAAKTVNITSTSSKRTKARPDTSPTAVHYHPTQYVSFDSTHPVEVKDVESFVRQRNPSMFKEEENTLNNYAYQQPPQAIQNYYANYQYTNGQYGQYFPSFYRASPDQWHVNNVRDKVASPPRIRVIAPLRHTTIGLSKAKKKAVLPTKKSAIDSAFGISYQVSQPSIFPGSAYNWHQFPTAAKPPDSAAAPNRYSNIPNFENSLSVFKADPFEGTKKRNGIPAMKTKLLMLRKRQTNEQRQVLPRGTKKQKRASDVIPQNSSSSKRRKISASSQASAVITRSGENKKSTPSSSRAKRSKVTSTKKPTKTSANKYAHTKKRQQIKHSRRTVITSKKRTLKQPARAVSDEGKPTAWLLNSTFLNDLNKSFMKQFNKARKSEIIRRHKQPKLSRKGKKRIVIQREHESLTKGIMKNALNLTFIQPTAAASNITSGVDRMLRNHTILSEVYPGNGTNTTAESYALSPLQEETGLARSNINDFAFEGRLDSSSNHVFNDEAMGSKSRAENLGADDVEESLMKSMEVADDGDANRKKKKSFFPLVTKKTLAKDESSISSLELRNVKKSRVPSVKKEVHDMTKKFVSTMAASNNTLAKENDGRFAQHVLGNFKNLKDASAKKNKAV